MGKEVEGLVGLTVGYLLRNHAKNYPNHMAVVDVERNKRYTYRELNRRVNRLANALVGLGLKKGEKVSILMSDRSEYVEIIFALNKVGAVWVPCNWRFTPEEAFRQIRHSDSTLIFVEEKFLETVEKIRDKLADVKQYVVVGGPTRTGYLAYEDLIGQASDAEPGVEVLDTDVLGIVYTSGTTGEPKGAVYTHRQLIGGWCFVAGYETGTTRDDRILNPYPMFHAGGTFISVNSLLFGATNYVFGKFDPLRYIKTIDEEKITLVWSVPTLLHFANQLSKQEKDKYRMLSCTRLVTSGAPFLTETQTAFSEQWPHIKLHSTYSATEGYFTNLRPEDQHRKVRCVGPPVFGTELKLMDDQGNEVPTGEIGIVYARGTSFGFSGYYKNPQATSEAYRGEWFTCQDVGYLDDEGYLYLVDRRKDMIVSGGEKIPSVEVENLLQQHPAVLEVAVVGVPDDRWGERVHAVVALKPGYEVGEEELLEWCKGRIAGYKRPRSVEFVAELPRSPVGKILKREIRDKYWREKGSKDLVNILARRAGVKDSGGLSS